MAACLRLNYGAATGLAIVLLFALLVVRLSTVAVAPARPAAPHDARGGAHACTDPPACFSKIKSVPASSVEDMCHAPIMALGITPANGVAGTTLGSRFCGQNRISKVTSRASLPYLAARTHTVLQNVCMWLILQR